MWGWLAVVAHVRNERFVALGLVLTSDGHVLGWAGGRADGSVTGVRVLSVCGWGGYNGPVCWLTWLGKN